MLCYLYQLKSEKEHHSLILAHKIVHKKINGGINMAKIVSSVAELIGDTPIIKLSIEIPPVKGFRLLIITFTLPFDVQEDDTAQRTLEVVQCRRQHQGSHRLEHDRDSGRRGNLEAGRHNR